MAPSTIEECFQFIATARKLAESFRTPVIVRSDANLATGQQDLPYPQISEDWLSPPADRSPWKEGVALYAWHPETGLSARAIPGIPGGDVQAHRAGSRRVEPRGLCTGGQEQAMRMRSRKFASLQRARKPPEVCGDEEGELLVAGWGSTRGAIGTGHWVHAIRYNMNMVVMLHDNNVYVLTKNQTSPTSHKGRKTNTHPRGAWLDPSDPIQITLGIQNASFVAQTIDRNPVHLLATLKAAHRHPGLSFVRIVQRCPHYPSEFVETLQDSRPRETRSSRRSTPSCAATRSDRDGFTGSLPRVRTRTPRGDRRFRHGRRRHPETALPRSLPTIRHARHAKAPCHRRPLAARWTETAHT